MSLNTQYRERGKKGTEKPLTDKHTHAHTEKEKEKEKESVLCLIL